MIFRPPSCARDPVRLVTVSQSLIEVKSKIASCHFIQTGADTRVCFPLSVTSHSWRIKNRVDQRAWVEVTTGTLIRKDGRSEQLVCVLTECNSLWEHSGCALYQIRVCLTYTSCLFCALWVLGMRMVRSFLYQKVLTYSGSLNPDISLSFSLSSCLSVSLLLSSFVSIPCSLNFISCWMSALHPVSADRAL